MSSDKSEDDEHDAISKQIVDYYKKFSQNKHLPKYFSGSALSYMPPIVHSEEIASHSRPIIIIDDTNSETLVEKVEERVKAVSPTSSVTSNRKLEWDNGADIGYNNCIKSTNLQKSLSLPILLTSVDTKKVEKTPKTTLSSQIVTVISYESGDDVPETKQTRISSSSSSSYRADVPIESSSSSFKTNPKPVSTSSSSFTSTLAYLKSKIGSPDAKSTPVMYIDTPIVPKPKKRIKHRSINLCLTKPIQIQCLDNQTKKGYDKKIQTSFAEAASKCIQTSASLEVLIEQRPDVDKPPQNQSVIVVNYDSGSDKRTYSSNTQTDAEISQCDSFEYYRQEKVQNSKNDSSKSAVSTDSSKSVPVLGQLITEQQSASLIRDVDRSIDLLQKLLKSKKYDAATKKRYIKKIVDKIVSTKYSEDSTTSSEFFVPKRQNDDVLQERKENLPLSKFTVKTFNDEFLPSSTEPQKRGLDGGDTGSSIEKEQNLSSGSYQSWKNEKTESERLLEEKQRGQGDQLVKFAKKERQHQISWINDEISHLTKLKGLLEKKMQKTTTVYMVSQQYDESSGSRNSRNYVIETEVPSCSCSDYNYSDKSGSRRNYQVREISGKADLNLNRKVSRDIEVVSDEKTTNIKVKARKEEEEDVGAFNPKPPSLVGSGKYDTFPRSKAEEERCFPCGRLKAIAKSDAEDRQHSQQYSFNVALDSQTNFGDKLDKIKEIINKYSKAQPPDKFAFSHLCKCTELLERAREPLPQLNHKTEEKSAPPEDCTCCKCKHHKTPLLNHKIEEKLSQPEDCRCCKCKRHKTPVINHKTDEKISQTEGCTCCKCSERKAPLNLDVQLVTPPDFKDSELLPPSKNSLCPCCKCKDSTTAPLVDSTKCQTDDCFCYNVEIQTDNITNEKTSELQSERSRTTSESSSGSTSETTSSATQSVQSCMCCKRKNVTTKRLYNLRKKLSDEVSPLCRTCYRQNRSGAYSPNCYMRPTHVCNCYTVVKTKTLNEIKDTINDLNELEEYCTCDNADNRNASDYCKHCKCKLKKTSKNRNGIAYMLTFDETLQEKKKKHKKQYLEEIKIKIPVSYKKKRKDKENKRKKAKHTDDSEDASSGEIRKRAGSTLQEYLNANRPDFLHGAEERRQTVNESRAIREELSDYNKIMFLKKCQEECEKNAKRLFSAKEMKEITKRNYKKLPEVQQRQNDKRERQLRQASRLMADTFNRKLRENVLKGKRNLSTDTKVINM